MGRVWTLRENLVLGLVILFLERVLMECWLGGAGGAGFWLRVSDCEGEFGGWGAFVGAGSLGRFGFVVSVSVGKG